jgi:hypothetical protein
MARNSRKPGYIPTTTVTETFHQPAGTVPDYMKSSLIEYDQGPGVPLPTAIHRYPGLPIQAHVGNGPYYPMQNYNGLTTSDVNAVVSNTGVIKDRRPYGQRRYNNMGYTDVQLNNGMRWKTLTGTTWSPYPVGQAFVPYIPGQTRGDAAGFVKRGPSTYNIQDWYNQGPGSQPTHPGGPGTVAGPQIYNPMSG